MRTQLKLNPQLWRDKDGAIDYSRLYDVRTTCALATCALACASEKPYPKPVAYARVVRDNVGTLSASATARVGGGWMRRDNA